MFPVAAAAAAAAAAASAGAVSHWDWSLARHLGGMEWCSTDEVVGSGGQEAFARG